MATANYGANQSISYPTIKFIEGGFVNEKISVNVEDLWEVFPNLDLEPDAWRDSVLQAKRERNFRDQLVLAAKYSREKKAFEALTDKENN